MRPPSIVNFERVVLLGLALGVLSSFLTWDETVASVSGSGMGTGTVIAIQAVTITLYLILLWFISRKGSPTAKWIYVVLSLLSLAIGLAGFGQIMKSGALQLILTLAQYALALVSLWLLFRPDAQAYFEDGRG